MNNSTICEATAVDVKEITQLFCHTIQNVNSKDYSKIEVDDWSSWHTDHEKWLKRIDEQYFIVAKLRSEIVGFGSLTTNGYLDFMFVHKDYQRRGIAQAILKDLEKKAKQQHNDFVYSDVSITAKGFFEKNGFRVEKQQLKKSKKEELINFRMIKKVFLIADRD